MKVKNNKGNTRKGHILIVEDDPVTLEIEKNMLERVGFNVFGVTNIEAANKEVAASLRSCWFSFNLVIVDLHLKYGTTEEFIRRLKDIIGVNVLVVTGDVNRAAKLVHQVDATVIKPIDFSTMVEIVKRLSKPLHRNIISPVARLHLWLATQELNGFGELKPFSQVFSGQRGREVEKIYGITRDDQVVSPTIYPPQGDVSDLIYEANRISMPSLLGCPVNCDFCIHPVSRYDEQGLQVVFLRPLTVGEMIGGFYLAMISPLLRELFEHGSIKKLVINFAGEGEGFIYNFENLIRFIKQVCKIIKPKVEFRITTVGDASLLQKFIDEGYTDLPITFYYSLNFPDSHSRERYMKGTKGHSVERELDLFKIIAEKSRNPVTVSIADFKGINDTTEAVQKFADLMRSRSLKWLKVKLQAGAKDSLSGAANASMMDIKKLRTKLIEAGVKQDIRARKIEGDENSGCGRCRQHWPDEHVTGLIETIH